MKFRRVTSKSQSQIISEWDRLAPTRFEQITSRKDFTFWNILAPAVTDLAKRFGGKKILDAGCGVGVLTSLLDEFSSEVIGVDPSSRSIEIARDNFGDEATFYCSSLEEFAEIASTTDMIVANMVLMDVIDLRHFLECAHALLRPGGALIFTITHPCFWPQYYGYANEGWFHYEQEMIVESPFRITSHQDCRLNSTHVHRPLEMYFDLLLETRFSIQLLREPMPTKSAALLYKKPWKTPRYLIGMAERERDSIPSRVQRLARKSLPQKAKSR